MRSTAVVHAGAAVRTDKAATSSKRWRPASADHASPGYHGGRRLVKNALDYVEDLRETRGPSSTAVRWAALSIIIGRGRLWRDDSTLG